MGSRPDPTGPHLPHPPEPAPDLTSAASAAVAALSELARFPAATDAAQRALAALSQFGPVVSRLRAIAALSQFGPVLYYVCVDFENPECRDDLICEVGHLPSAGEGATERESARNVDMTGGPIASGVEHGRDSLNGGSRVISSHEASKGLGDNVSNREQHSAWCGICRVGCNSFQILEQHKNGKRHKKNLQRIEELKRVVCVSADMQDAGTSGVGAVVEGEDAGKIRVNIDCEPEIGNGRIAVQPPRSSTEPSDRKSSPCMKRESNGNGTIAKRAKNVVAPIVCSVCNIKCDTREVFDKHLSGKKHISKVNKHSQLRQPRNREVGLRAVYLNHLMSQVPTSQPSDYQFLIPEGSYLPPMPQAYTPLLPQVHYQVDTAGNALVGSFQHPGAQALEAAVSLQGRHNISPALPGVHRW